MADGWTDAAAAQAFDAARKDAYVKGLGLNVVETDQGPTFTLGGDVVGSDLCDVLARLEERAEADAAVPPVEASAPTGGCARTIPPSVLDFEPGLKLGLQLVDIHTGLLAAAAQLRDTVGRNQSPGFRLVNALATQLELSAATAVGMAEASSRGGLVTHRELEVVPPPMDAPG